MSNLNVNKISAVGGGSTITIAGIASVTNAVSVGNSVTANAFYGSGASLTGIDASSIKNGSDVKAQAIATGINVTGDVNIENGNISIKDTSDNESFIYFTHSPTANRRSYIGAVEGTGNSNSLVFATNGDGLDGSERLRITSTGLVGIGTNSPDNLLEIYKGSTGTYLKMGGDDAQNGRALTFTSGNTSSNGALHTLNATSSNGAIAFATAGTERMRIDSAGFVQGNINSPAWFGSQDTQHNITTGTWTSLLNLGNSVVNPSINNSGWNESTGTFTAQAGQAGFYYCFGCAGIDDVQDSDIVYCGISKNGANPIFYTENRALDQSSNIILGGVMVAQIIYLAVGDTAQLRVYHNEGSTEPTEPNRCFFGGYRLAFNA